MTPIPHEIAIGGIYLPPLLIAAAVGAIATQATARTLNRYRLSRYVANPPLVWLSMMLIYTVVLGTLVIGI